MRVNLLFFLVWRHVENDSSPTIFLVCGDVSGWVWGEGKRINGDSAVVVESSGGHRHIYFLRECNSFGSVTVVSSNQRSERR